jgi:hypothetical protein
MIGSDVETSQLIDSSSGQNCINVQFAEGTRQVHGPFSAIYAIVPREDFLEPHYWITSKQVTIRVLLHDLWLTKFKVEPQ